VAWHASDDLANRLKEATGGRLADLVVVCTGAPSAFEQALDCVDRGGTIQFFATTEPEVSLAVPLNRFWRNGITLLPSYGASPLDITVAIDLLRAGRIPVEDMITHRLPLAETGKGFALVAEGDRSIKVIIEPHSY
jgi:L-iditol 2-dehydrogenase